MSIRYEPLFEVKLFHEYFMTGTDGLSVFEKPSQSQRLSFADEIYREDRASITNVIEFGFPRSLRELYRGLQLKLHPTNSGCRVAVKVKPRILSDSSQVWEPAIPLPEDLNIFILISRLGSGIDDYSNARIRREMPGTYFFSNSGDINTKAWPYLSSPIPSYNFSFAYEQGQLASFGTSDIRQFFRKGSNEVWQTVKGSAFASEADRFLLPTRFDYSFIDTPGIKNASFILKDRDGNEIKSFNATDTIGLEKVRLDFSDKVGNHLLGSSGSVEDRILFLEISGTSGLNRTHPVMFGDFVLDDNPWGVIHLTARPRQTDFRFLEQENYLLDTFPVFEIPIKSRFNYWRYRNDKDRELQATSTHNGFLFKDGKYLITNRPLSVYQSFSKLSSDLNAGSIYVPAPSSLSVARNDEGQMFFDISVQRSELFPVV